jgi:hypothetical protein
MYTLQLKRFTYVAAVDLPQVATEEQRSIDFFDIYGS